MEIKAFQNFVVENMTVIEFCDWLLHNVDESMTIEFNGNNMIHVAVDEDRNAVEFFSVKGNTSEDKDRTDYENDPNWKRMEDMRIISRSHFASQLSKIDSKNRLITVNGSTKIKVYMSKDIIELTS